MSSYESFARVYDLFMDNIPYEEWCGYLTGLLEDQGIRDGLLLELGCGTGNMTRLLAGKGYDMIGVDNSVDMLEIAMEKKEQEGQDILYLLQDMREFEGDRGCPGSGICLRQHELYNGRRGSAGGIPAGK